MFEFPKLFWSGAAIAACLVWSPPVWAVTVDSANSAHFRFDLMSETAEFIGFFYECNDTCAGEETVRPPNTEQILASGASFQISFGTSRGGSDLGVRYGYNGFPFNIYNENDYLRSAPGDSTHLNFAVSGIDYLFATILFVDDSFGIDRFELYGNGLVRAYGISCDPGPECVSTPTPVPISPSWLMFMTGLLLTGSIVRATQRKAAQQSP